MNRNVIWLLVATLMIVSIGSPVHAAPGGQKGKPGDDGDGGGQTCDLSVDFPFVAFPADGGLVLASKDGCRQETVVSADQLGGFRLTFNGQSGYYAWSSNNWTDNTYSIYAQEFGVAADGTIAPGTLHTILENQAGAAFSFDIQGDLTAPKLAMSVNYPGIRDEIVYFDSASGAGLTTVYPTETCLEDSGVIDGCYEAGSAHVEMSGSGTSIFFSVTGDGSNGGRIDSIVRSDSVADAWSEPALLLRGHSYYSEPSVESLNADESLLAVRYLAGFQQDGLRDDRIIFLNPSCEFCDPSNPDLPDAVIQNVPSWHASWTAQGTVLVLGNQGKRRKLVHPIEEFDPSSGLRTPLGITLGDHPIIDSSQ